MKKVVFLILIASFLFSFSKIDWGFYAHARINYLAVFTLPSEVIGFYKKHIDYIEREAVGPDKRRYASKHEAVRHYIDLDVWGTPPYENLPRNWVDALISKTTLHIISTNGDTSQVADNQFIELENFDWRYKSFFRNNVLKNYYEDSFDFDCDSLKSILKNPNFDCQTAFAVDHLSEFGILPWHLQSMQHRLTKAFEEADLKRILRYSADFGHYIGDAHVPLHTTENYNGQLTNQRGIHGFWESRLPELFAEDTYDFWVGQAKYIDDKESYFWNIVLESHSLVDSVLLIEKDLSKKFPKEKQYCVEERGATLVETPCRDYAAAFHNRMDGMVERRMRDAIYAIGCVWYTAWIDAGSPKLDFEKVADIEKDEELEKAFQSGQIKGRNHSN